MEEALILERKSPAPVAQIGRLLAFHFDLHPTEAIARVRYGGGILIERASPAKVREVKDHLDATDVASRILSASDLEEIPREFRAFALDLSTSDMTARTITGNRLSLAPKDILALHLYGLLPDTVEVESHRETQKREHAEKASQRFLQSSLLDSDPRTPGASNLSPRARQLSETLAEKKLQGMEFHLTLFSSAPIRLLRIRKNDFDFSSLGVQKQPHSMDNFLMLLDEIVAYLPHAWNREPAVEFLRDLDPNSILRFKSEEIHNFERWLYQWVRLEAIGAETIDERESGGG